MGISIFVLFCVSVFPPAVCWAQGWNRKGKTEVFAFFRRMDGQEDEWFQAVDVNIDSTFIGGVGIGYNFSEYLNLNMDVWYGSIDMKLEPVPVFGSGPPAAQGNANLFAADLNLDYNVLKSRFTPVLSGGIGFINFDGDRLDSGSEFSQRKFSYNLGAGLRWDIAHHVFMKAMFKHTVTELQYVSERISFDSIGLNIGYLF